MAKTPNGEASLVRRNGGVDGWYWIMRQGNRLVYHGPYASKHAAEFYQQDVDTYRHDGGRY